MNKSIESIKPLEKLTPFRQLDLVKIENINDGYSDQDMLLLWGLE